MKKTALVLFNLGGPDRLSAVEPFLYNLFSDPAILQIPNPFRALLAKVISSRRAPLARGIYEKIGGKSPLLTNTYLQAEALKKELNAQAKNETFEVFVSMRYWHPFSDETVQKVKAYAPHEIILLPLYPQYSTTTSASSLNDWERACRKASLIAPTKILCCYPVLSGFVEALKEKALKAYKDALRFGHPRFLYSAHGLPEKIIKQGDPYQSHCEMTAAALNEALGLEDLDSVLCYQSRVGPLKWIGPSTEDEVKRASSEKRPSLLSRFLLSRTIRKRSSNSISNIESLRKKQDAPIIFASRLLERIKILLKAWLKPFCLFRPKSVVVFRNKVSKSVRRISVAVL